MQGTLLCMPVISLSATHATLWVKIHRKLSRVCLFVALWAALDCAWNLLERLYSILPQKPLGSQTELTIYKVLNPLDAICNKPRRDAVCVSQLRNSKKVDKALLQERPDVKIFLPFRFFFYKPQDLFKPNTYNNFLAAVGGDHVISLIDEISYISAPAPPLSQLDEIPQEQFCNGDNRPENCGPNCRCTHMVDIPLNAIVEVVLVDEVQSPNLSHPFHLHGYSFTVVGIGRSPDQNVKKINLKHALDLDRRGLLHRQFNLPPFKDTIAVPNNGYVILRFRADNPGFWLFHCHFLFHIVIGMNLIIHVGTQSDLPPVPHNFPRCGHHLPPITPPHHG